VFYPLTVRVTNCFYDYDCMIMIMISLIVQASLGLEWKGNYSIISQYYMHKGKTNFSKRVKQV